MYFYRQSNGMCWLIPKIFRKKGSILAESDPMKKFLVVGLGNIGEKYAGTRHNIGFQVLNALTDEKEVAFKPEKLGDVAELKIKGKSVLCLKPSTYMNLSGKAVKYWMEKEKIPLSNVLIIADDINLPFGSIRLKAKGSDGGHNGLQDIQHKLQTTAYHRFRFGIGDDFSKGSQTEYVLGRWSEEESAKLKERLDRSLALIESFVHAGAKNTMNTFNNT